MSPSQMIWPFNSISFIGSTMLNCHFSWRAGHIPRGEWWEVWHPRPRRWSVDCRWLRQIPQVHQRRRVFMSCWDAAGENCGCKKWLNYHELSLGSWSGWFWLTTVPHRHRHDESWLIIVKPLVPWTIWVTTVINIRSCYTTPNIGFLYPQWIPHDAMMPCCHAHDVS